MKESVIVIHMITEDSIIEQVGVALLVLCLLYCLYYLTKSRLTPGRFFWSTTALAFLMMIRKELNYLPDLYLASDFTFLSRGYEWWVR